MIGNKHIKRWMKRRSSAVLAACFAAFILPSSAMSAAPVCATVQMGIQQELTFERQGFDAHMIIDNGLPTADLKDVTITVQFEDENNNPVIASSDPNSTTAKFFINLDTYTNIDRISRVNGATGTGGTIAAGTKADIHWFILPAKGAAAGSSIATLYYVGATLDYTLAGTRKNVVVSPDTIRVKPLPALVLDYFIPAEVFGDDPFTTAIEVPEPFNLGLRIANRASGAAGNLQMESAQPVIKDNKQGLAVSFDLLGSSVNGQAVTPNLNLNFGTLDAYATAVARWNMQATLSGKITSFSSSFTHADALGGQLTSLLDGVFTHYLIHDVVVDLPGRDPVRDFLASDSSILQGNAGVVRVYESNGSEALVEKPAATLVHQSTNGGDSLYSLTYTPSVGATTFAHISVVDPFNGTKPIKAVVRSDGKQILSDNAWLSKTSAAGGSFYFNIFDANSTGRYTIIFGDPAVAQPPVLEFLPVPDYSLQTTKELRFTFKGIATNGSIPVLSVNQTLAGSSFIDNGDGTGTFVWIPAEGQEGSYPITFSANDGSQIAERTVQITVLALNSAPVVVDDSFTTDEDTSVGGNVLANDSDPDGDVMTATLVSGVANGQLSFASDGTFNYVPNFNFSGTDTFTYTASDGIFDSIVAVVSIQVNALNDAPTVGIKATGYALGFDGVNDVTIMPDAMISAQNPITIETWFNTSASGGIMGYQTPVDTYGASLSAPLMYVGVDGLLYAGFASDTKQIVSKNVVNDGVWHHVAFVADDNGSQLFIDGVFAGSQSTPLSHAAYTLGQIGVVDNYGWAGGAASQTAYFNGTIDEVRVWSTARTAVEIQTNMHKPLTGAEIGLAALWSLNDGTTNNALDTSNQGKYLMLGDGSLNSEPSWVLSTTPLFTDNFALLEDNYANLTVTTSDAEGDLLTTTISVLPTKGILYQTVDGVLPSQPVLSVGEIVLHASGKLIYVPELDGNGAPYDTFSVDVTDSVNVTSLLVMVDVTPVQDAPNAVADVLSTDEEIAATIDVLANDFDVDGDTIQVQSVSAPANGIASIDAYGSILYTPNVNWNGVDTFDYVIDDGNGGTSTSTITVTVIPVNDAPVSVGDSFVTDEDMTLSGTTVLVNDSDVDGDALTAVLVSSPANGTLTLNADGTFSYAPNANWNGVDTFTYTANDGALNSNTSTVSITVNSVNDAPVASANALVTDEDVSGSTTVTVTDPDSGDTHTYAITTAPANGSAAVSTSGVVSYTPNLNYNGSDSLTVTVTDSAGATAMVVAPVTINAVNDAPASTTASITTDEDVTSIGVTPSVIDVDDTTHTFTIVTQASNGVAGIVNGQLVYTPNANFNGSDSLTFKASDAGGLSVVGMVSVTINSVNDAPVSVGDSYVTDEDVTSVGTTVLVNDSDVDGDALTAVLVSTTANGTLTLNIDGTFSYAPNANWNGVDTFTYTANDGALNSNVSTVTITVNAVNDVPVATANPLITDEDVAGSTAITVTDPDIGDTHTYSITTAAANGSATVSVGGVVSYTPNLNYNGSDSVTVTVTDTAGATTTVVIPVTVNAVNDAPESTTSSITMDEDVSSVGVTPTVVDVDDTTHTFTIVTQASNGVASIVNNQLVYLSNLNYNGLDSFTYRATDAGGLSVVGTAKVTVIAVNDAPSSTTSSITTDEDVSSVGVTPAVVDVDDTTHTITIVTQPANGVASIVSNQLVYLSNLNYNGLDSFTYRATDGGGLSVVGTANVTVIPVNDAPASTTASITTDEDVTSVGITPSVIDVDDTTHTFTIVTQASNGVASIVNNQLVYLSNLNYNGVDSFTYRATDAGGLSVVGTASVTVIPVNDAPVSVGDSFVTDEDNNLNGSTILVNDSDVDGDSLIAVLVSATSNGTLTLNADGTFSYAPDANWYGVDTFTYNANDGALNSNISTVSITVNPVNDVPVADAGIDQYAFVDDVVMFNGMASSDIDGDPLTYSWRIASAPTASSAMLSSATSVMTWFVPDEQGDYIFELVVNDGQVNSIADQVSLHVPNRVPVAVLITDAYAYVDDTVVLDGYSSYDLDRDPLTYYWSLVSPSGSASQLSDPYASVPTFMVDHKGVYTATLIVHDGIENSIPVSRTIVIPNRAPVADAGLDQTVYICDLATVDGYSSYDLDHDPITYAWSLSSPQGSSSVLTSMNNSNTSFIPDVTGQYLAQLVVHDGTVQSTADVATLNAINPPVNVITNTHFGSASRMLVLLPKVEHDDDAAPLSYMHLESILQAKGWLYTLVSDEESFVEEMHTGGYSTYAIFANQVGHETAVELQAAVYRGEGLLYAAAEELDELSNALGIETKDSAKVWQLDMLQSQVSGATTIRFVDETKVQTVELNGAMSFTKAAIEDDDAITYAPIAAMNGYGHGQAVYLGFDMLTEIETGMHNGVLANVLNDSLEYIKPASTLVLAGAVIPIVMDIENTTCVPTLGNIIVNLPQGFEVVDKGGASVQTDGSLLWSFNMQGNMKEQRTFWVRLPVAPAAYSISGSLEAGYSSGTVVPLNTIVFDIDLLQQSIETLFLSVLDIPMNNDLQESLSNVYEMWLDYEYSDLQDALLDDEYLFSDINMPESINLLYSRLLRYTHIVQENSSSSD